MLSFQMPCAATAERQPTARNNRPIAVCGSLQGLSYEGSKCFREGAAQSMRVSRSWMCRGNQAGLAPSFLVAPSSSSPICHANLCRRFRFSPANCEAAFVWVLDSTVFANCYSLVDRSTPYRQKFARSVPVAIGYALPLLLTGFVSGYLTGISRAPAVGDVVPAHFGSYCWRECISVRNRD